MKQAIGYSGMGIEGREAFQKIVSFVLVYNWGSFLI